MYRKGEAKDKQDILDFINYVFSFADAPIDFRKVLPKAYGENVDKEDIHHMIVDKDRIKSIVGVYPAEFVIGGVKLKTGYIGSVSVHPYARHQGYMKELMKQVHKQMKDEEFDLAVLSGQRQRYEHYGYYRGGQRYQYQVDRTNLFHYFMNKYDVNRYHVEETLQDHIADLELTLKEQKSENDTHMDAIYALYQRQMVTGRTREGFFEDMLSFGASLYAITMHGICIGYISINFEEEYINEMEVLDVNFLPEILYLLLEEMGSDMLGVKLSMYETQKAAFLTRICERYTIGQAQMFRIYHYPKVLKALLMAKNEMRPLQSGSFVLGVETKGKYLIEISQNAVDGMEINVLETTRTADVRMTEEQVIRILLSTDYEQALLSGEVHGLEQIPAGWFPLPLCLNEADRF